VTWDADGDGLGDDAQAATRSPATIAVATGQRWGAPRSWITDPAYSVALRPDCGEATSGETRTIPAARP